jgi:predicted methyltransferase
VKRIPALLLPLLLLGCGESAPPESPPPEAAAPPSQSGKPGAETAENPSGRLEAVLAAKPEGYKARYRYRHPKETLQFFGIRPGMTVVEALPGRGWYSQLLIPYLGDGGRLIGANYAQDMWPRFGFFDQAFIDSMKTWTTDWPEEAKAWRGSDGAVVEAFEFGSMPAALEGQADAVLMIRAVHNLARFEDEGGYLTAAINDSFRVLRPGGTLGIVQHEARPDMPDEWASGRNGYLKKQFVIDRLSAAGFELVGESDVNQNPNDRPTTDDVVWRLPPSYQTSQDDPALRAQMDAIGESNRMTLKFRKPR